MSASQVLKLVRQKLKVSSPNFSLMLGYKSKSHVWQIESEIRNPSPKFCRRLIRLAKEKADMDISMDMLLGDLNAKQ